MSALGIEGIDKDITAQEINAMFTQGKEESDSEFN
jgi:hypothetical protein